MTDKLTKRFVSIDNGEVYYITDTQNLKTLNDYIQEFKKPEYEFTEKEAISAAKEEYWQMIYENSMSAKENEDMLNRLFEENEQLKRENELLSDELEQCKAVIDNRWEEYLDKKGDVE